MSKIKHSPLTPEEFKLLPDLTRYLRDQTKLNNVVRNIDIREHFSTRLKGSDSRRRIQLMIHEIRVTGRLKNLLASSNGYFVSKSKEDRAAYKSALKRRINSLKEVYESIG